MPGLSEFVEFVARKSGVAKPILVEQDIYTGFLKRPTMCLRASVEGVHGTRGRLTARDLQGIRPEETESREPSQLNAPASPLPRPLSVRRPRAIRPTRHAGPRNTLRPPRNARPTKEKFPT